METAKVDIRKLQLLNDRINQCIDALNQVRLSVHGLSQGLSHTSGQVGSQFGLGAPSFGANPFTQAGASPFGPQGIGQMPLGQNPWNQGFVPGLSHTGGQGLGNQSFGANPFTQGLNPFTQGGSSPFGFGSQGIGQMPLGQSPFVPGLSHTGGQSPFGQQGINPYLPGVSPEALEASVRPIWADPILSARITQTFPYAQYPVPPVVTIY